MCWFKSGIILKDKVFVPDYDNHTDMLRKLRIADNEKNAKEKFVRAELHPYGADVFSPIDTWKFVVDQDVLPDWFVPEFDRGRTIEAVKKWASKHIYVDIQGLSLHSGKFWLKNCSEVVCNNSVVVVRGNSTVWAHNDNEVLAYDNSIVTVFSGNKVTARDNSEVTVGNNSVVMAFNNSKVKAYYSSEVRAYGNSEVKACGNSKVVAYNNSGVVACDDSEVEAFDSSKVVAYSNSRVKACGNSKVVAQDNSMVEAFGSSGVTAYGNTIVVITINSSHKGDNIVLMDNSTLINYKTNTTYQYGDWKLVRSQRGG